ncbi:IS110 family transposase [Streptomyces sp. NBC_00048]|uniref:IS110 family transposase n=1 Tax=Streptomyces sp. NBC_00048 TaxID=2975628 RepID=UPI003254E0C5
MEKLVLFVGDDWAEDHHDVEVQDGLGRRLGSARLTEGVEGIAKLHALIARHAVGIETDRGPWVQALLAAGYRGYAVNPRQAARFKERYGTPGAKSDKGDAHALADMVRIDAAQLRPIAGDSEQAQAAKVVARAHQTLVWERTRTFQRLRNTLRGRRARLLGRAFRFEPGTGTHLLSEPPPLGRASHPECTQKYRLP